MKTMISCVLQRNQASDTNVKSTKAVFGNAEETAKTLTSQFSVLHENLTFLRVSCIFIGFFCAFVILYEKNKCFW